MPALAGTPCRSPYLARPITGLAAAPAGASPSNAVHQSDRELDGCALPEKVEKNLHPPAPGAGPLHDRDQPGERAALDLHPVPRPEGRERPDDAALARARHDERDRAVLQGGGGRTEGDEAPHSGRPDHPVVLLEERDAHEEVARKEGRYLVTPPLEDAGQEDPHAAPLELLHGVIFLARLAAYHVPPPVLSLKVEKRREGGHTAPGRGAIAMPRACSICSRGPRFSSAFAPQGGISNPPFSRTPAALVQARSRARRHRPEARLAEPAGRVLALVAVRDRCGEAVVPRSAASAPAALHVGCEGQAFGRRPAAQPLQAPQRRPVEPREHGRHGLRRAHAGR